MQRSIISIRRAFTFHNNFYKHANQILSNIRKLFHHKHPGMKKHSNKTKHKTSCTNSTLTEENLHLRAVLEERRLTDNSIFIGVHVR